MIPCYQFCQLIARHDWVHHLSGVLGHCSWILIPVPSTAYIAGGIDGFGAKPELTESFELVQTTESSTDDQCINVVGSHVADRVM
jgi:hypothetical protein